ncbi:response regulator transcription factor [Cupriavidus agavae]|uniref:Response regulator receiver domain-containing protein n=1 Tax=Cupriavidus agavae TaxID=1001822 RepID=A0A4Q7RXE7_9BURK|nr:response regulator [Cupriavidus agavae]RZT36892.1 response regulator receiver domain-containing protein [Cupriavidus agavae]
MNSAQLVAIVDDDESIRMATASLVRSLGRQTRQFESAEAFLAFGELADFACVISDFMMPGMTGVAMHERMLALGYRLPTFFITAFPSDELKARALTNGALAVLHKPVDADDMAHWLDVALG